jgi:two-component system OmpR family response regulator
MADSVQRAAGLVPAETNSERWPMHLLLVGAYRPLVKALRQGLEDEDFTVDVALGGEEADDRLRTAAHDAVVLDLVHPQEAGLSLLRRWRRAGLKTPVLVLAASDVAGDREAAFDAGADDRVVKPFGLEEVLARLRAVAGSADVMNTERPYPREPVCAVEASS